jgi:chromosomal replication initiator protein
LLSLPENRSALVAVAELARCLKANEPDQAVSPVYLHGPTGAGKTCLVGALLEEIAGDACVLSANAFPLAWDQSDPASADRYEHARRCDLLIVEDLQHLPARASGSLVQLLDERLRCRLPMVFTASCGPAQLAHRGSRFPARLTNRLAGGLVVALTPLSASSRRILLEAMTRRRRLPVADDVLDWLAASLTGGGRQLEGALNQLQTLRALNGKPARLEEVREQFRVEADVGKPTIDRIIRRVSAHFRVEPSLLRSPRRQRHLLLARHVSMYLARQLTRMSLEQIGACFGGRDHSTVLHACRKVEEAMKNDATLSGAVRQMRAELT